MESLKKKKLYNLPYNEISLLFGRSFEIFINGKMPRDKAWFEFEFIHIHETDIALHMGIQPYEGFILLSTMVNGKYKKLKYLYPNPFPFSNGSFFMLRITKNKKKFKITANGKVIARYKHIINPKLIYYFEMNTSAVIHHVEKREY